MHSVLRTALAVFIAASIPGCGGEGGAGTGADAAGGSTVSASNAASTGAAGSTDSTTSIGSSGSVSSSVNASAPVLATPTVVLNAAVNVSETGGDDLAAARGLFRSASYPESNGGLESSAALLTGIGARSIRIINAEGGPAGSSLDGSGNLVLSARLSWHLPWVKKYGLMAHVVVGQWQPGFLTVPAPQWDEAGWAKYQDYATKFVRHIAVEFNGQDPLTYQPFGDRGFPETIFEVGNEIDITSSMDDLWTLDFRALPQADEGRYQHYMRVFAVWSRAVAQVAAENPGRGIRIAGPAMGGQTLFLTRDQFWPERFVQDVAAAGLRLDVVTHHFYCDVLNGWTGVPGSGLRAQLLRIRRALVAAGRGDTPIFETEYGPSEGSDDTWSRINYSNVSAAWGAMFVHEALAGTASGGSALGVRDNFGGSLTGNPSISSFTHIHDGVDYPKPMYNAFRMFTLLSGARKTVTVPELQPNVQAFGSADATSAALIVSNFKFQFDYPTVWMDHTVNERVVPGFTNLPFNGAVGVDRYLIDANTGNLEAMLDSGRALDYSATMLTRVERCSATVSQGTLNLPARTLGPSAVSLWIVKSGAGAGLPACN